MPFLIETDVLLALISAGDKHHGEVVSLIDEMAGDIRLSPYSLVELDSLLKSGKIAVSNAEEFYNVLDEVFSERGIVLTPIKPIYFGRAWVLRGNYRGLTYFDSLHAAVGLVEDLEVVSYDREYARVKNLRYRLPTEFV